MNFIRILVAITAILLPLLGFTQPAPRLELVSGSVIASGLSKVLSTSLTQKSISNEEWEKAFPVYTRLAYSKGVVQPVAGRYKIEETSLVFTPLFPFVEGESYIAILNYGLLIGSSSSDILIKNKSEFQFTMPAKEVAPTSIQAIYPSSDTVPENLLRMYVYFSAPMTPGDAYQNIHLLNEKGEPVERPFLIVEQELWDTDRKRFTLLFDPGRIKRGIKSNLDLGLPLQRNKSYRLVIDSLWRDAHGRILAQRYEKKMMVEASCRTKLTTDHWKITAPEAGTMNSLRIEFERPLDHALALKYIFIRDSLGEVLEGEAVLVEGDRIWMFTPYKPWSAGRYTMTISPLLEDAAGNNFNNPFDIDLSVSERINSDEPLTMEFVVSKASN